MSAQFKINAADPASVVAPGARTRSAALHRSDAGRARHRRPRCRRTASSRRRSSATGWTPTSSPACPTWPTRWRPPSSAATTSSCSATSTSTASRPPRCSRAVCARSARRLRPFIPLRFEEGYALSRGRHRARVLVRSRLHRHGGLRHRLQGGGRGRGGGAAWAWLSPTTTSRSTSCPKACPWPIRRCDANCPSSILAGVGVALKLVQVLGGRLGQPHLWRDFTDFATLGTVADLMPMRDENRALVSDGIARMNAAPRPCIAALAGHAAAPPTSPSAPRTSASRVIPRLNAAGRMGDAQLALDLLMTDDFERGERAWPRGWKR